jgi:transcription elongation factor Elf1
LEPDPDWTCDACKTKLHTPPIMTPAPMPAPEKTPCPACGYGMLLKRTDAAAKFKCPSCQTPLAYNAQGQVEEYDEFKEYLKQRKKEITTGKMAPAKKVESKESEEEEEPHEERTPGGLLMAFIVFPMLAAYGITFWPEAMRQLELWAEPLFKFLGIGQI